MVPMTLAEATDFAASFDDDESRGYAEEFIRDYSDDFNDGERS